MGVLIIGSLEKSLCISANIERSGRRDAIEKIRDVRQPDQDLVFARGEKLHFEFSSEALQDTRDIIAHVIWSAVFGDYWSTSTIILPEVRSEECLDRLVDE